jgi:hypothetical protein
VNQKELREMADARIRDAEVLISGGRWEFGYYAAGYAVECALKSALLARMPLTGWIFRENVKADQWITHEFMKLLLAAELIDELNDKLKESAAAGGEFSANWNTVNLWKVTSRYEPKSEAEAKGLFAAIVDQPHGVLTWIKSHW